MDPLKSAERAPVKVLVPKHRRGTIPRPLHFAGVLILKDPTSLPNLVTRDLRLIRTMEPVPGVGTVIVSRSAVCDVFVVAASDMCRVIIVFLCRKDRVVTVPSREVRDLELMQVSPMTLAPWVRLGWLSLLTSPVM